DNTPWEFPEPNANHVSVQSQGTAANLAMHSKSMGWTSNIPDLKAGASHTVRVLYIPGTLNVFVDDLQRPVLTVPVRIDSLLSLDEGKCWIGFTSATGGGWANFDLFSIESAVTINIRNILFDYDKATLQKGSTGALDTLAMVLQKDQTLNAEIEGHTDNKGSHEYNMKLSHERAATARAYLVKRGIAGSRLRSRGFGATVPVATNGTDEGRAENRRVVAKLFVP
ncbi:MAG TPA: OmpA family protein, partial [Candidatus Kapabacteria bacterium]|nr:OmpA family protein [Candidatus Kapabacteria bacterium]